MLSHNNTYADNPKKHNQDIWEFRTKAKYTACISSLACENCGLIVSDGICLCMGIFECPKCKHEHGKNKFNISISNYEIEYQI